MYLSDSWIIPPREWQHKPTIKNDEGYTVAHYLKDNKLPISNEWYDESM